MNFQKLVHGCCDEPVKKRVRHLSICLCKEHNNNALRVFQQTLLKYSEQMRLTIVELCETGGRTNEL